MQDARCDIAVIGAGAAGLMAAIQAGRAATKRGSPARIAALDGARTLGAKILVAGGGRCNVTHFEVAEAAFAGSSRNAIRKVLKRFDVPETVSFFREIGVELKREETGKLFPTTDSARTVLNALLGAARAAGVEIRHPWRVETIERAPGGGFVVQKAPDDGSEARGAPGETEITAERVILATGGKSLPKSGSDGKGYEIARLLGHTTTERIFPALVPLTLPKDHFLCGLSGLSARAALEVRSSTGKRLESFTNSLLCAHFGISGPAALDVSRYFLDARARDPGATLVVNWLPGVSPEALDAAMVGLGPRTAGRFLHDAPNGLPERLARALCAEAGVDAAAPGHALTREQRKALARAVCGLVLPVTGDRGWVHAEVTAGGVPLSELRLETMESRVTPGLHLCGEICDVDGRIGGFNFQWAWASGFVAGVGAV